MKVLMALRLLVKAKDITQRMLFIDIFYRAVIMQISINQLEPSHYSLSAGYNDLLVFLEYLTVFLAQSTLRAAFQKYPTLTLLLLTSPFFLTCPCKLVNLAQHISDSLDRLLTYK
jgi:hypothetical protein